MSFSSTAMPLKKPVKKAKKAIPSRAPTMQKCVLFSKLCDESNMDDLAVETWQADLRRWSPTVEDIDNEEDQCIFKHPRNPACIVERLDGSDDVLDSDVPKVIKGPNRKRKNPDSHSVRKKLQPAQDSDDDLERNMDVDGVEESPEMADEELGASLLFLVAFSYGEQLVD